MNAMRDGGAMQVALQNRCEAARISLRTTCLSVLVCGRIIGDACAVSIAEIHARGLPPIRIVGSGFGGGHGCPGGAPGAGRRPRRRTADAGLALRVARRGRAYAIVTSGER